MNSRTIAIITGKYEVCFELHGMKTSIQHKSWLGGN